MVSATAYRHLLAAQLRSQLQYRASFVVDCAGSALFAVIDLLAVAVMFRVTRTLAGFGFTEVFLMAALATFAYAGADLVVGNVDRLRLYVRTGMLDAMLVRPLGTLWQLVTVDLAIRRTGRVVVGTVTIVLAVRLAPVAPTLRNVALLVLTALTGVVIVGGMFVATATVAFWWIEAGEVTATVTGGGRDFASYPLAIYSGLFRRLFGYLLGLSFVAYYPALALLGRPDPLGGPTWLGWLSPLVALASVGAATTMWRLGIRHYRSTGS